MTGRLCECGCGRYWEDCRAGVKGDSLAELLYCAHNYADGAFGHCEDCSLVNYGRDCKNNPINEG